MAKSHTHLTPEERYHIRGRVNAGDARSETARSLGQPALTVTRELKRDSGQRGYRPRQAQRLAAARRRGVRLTEAVKSQVPRLQNTHRSLAKRLRFWRNPCFTERCTSRLNVGLITDKTLKEKLGGCSDLTIWRLRRVGKLPKPKKLGSRNVTPENEADKVIATLIGL